MSERLVIIGSGMAAARLLQCLEGRADFRVTVIGAEPQPSYNRILLSSVLSREKSTTDLPLLDRAWYDDNNVELITGNPAVAVDREARHVQTACGATIPYDRLVFATGSRAHIPKIPGTAFDGVLGFRSLEDLNAIRDRSTRTRHAVVVGGGLLGLEAAHGLNAMGVPVTVVHRRGRLMNRQLDREAGALLQSLLEARGIKFVMNASPGAVLHEQGRATGIQLDDGTTLPGDLVLFAAGIEPNCEPARECGLPCHLAIEVDPFLRTPDPRVYALGECCQIEGRTFGLVAPVRKQAQILADVLVGKPTEGYTHVEAATQLKVSGVDLYSAGSFSESPGDQDQVLRDGPNGIYRRLIFDGSRLVGAILLGDRSGGSWYESLIESGEPATSWRPYLLFGPDFCATPG